MVNGTLIVAMVWNEVDDKFVCVCVFGFVLPIDHVNLVRRDTKNKQILCAWVYEEQKFSDSIETSYQEINTGGLLYS